MSEKYASDDRHRSADNQSGARSQGPDDEEQPISQPGGFKNDPADPSNPNEALERSRRKLRP